MSGNNNEIVHEGWLTKSPPSKRIWKARWRRRWFVLRHSGELPGQFVLLYYTDRNCRKLKGSIDLDQCEQVDAGLRFENSKQNYPHMFDVKTPKRTYYLAADSETDMNKWVDCVCQVCGLKSATDDNSVEFTEESNDSLMTAPEAADGECSPTSPVTPGSGPYIPISECISGKPLNTPMGISDFNNIISRQALMASSNGNKVGSKDSFQAHPLRENKLNNIKQTICDDDISKCDNNKSVTLVMSMPKRSVDRFNSLYGDKNILTNMNTKKEDLISTTKITNIESAKKMAVMKSHGRRPPDLKLPESVPIDFYDSPRKIVVDKTEWSPADWRQSSAPLPNWETFPSTEMSEDADLSPSDIGSWNVVQRFGKLSVVDSKLPIVTNSLNRVTKQKAQPDTFSLRRPVAPPRPPKPSHLIIREDVHNYLNIEMSGKDTRDNKNNAASPSSLTPQVQSVSSDEMYDIPRSHQPQNEEKSLGFKTANRHNYLNAAPSETTGNVFIYDFPEAQTNDVHGTESNLGEPISPRSEGSGSGAIYSNLPSPLNTGIPTPPAVNRDLKPSRKTSDSGLSNEPSPGGSLTFSLNKEPSPSNSFNLGATGDISVNGPPSIDRTLKPKKLQSEGSLKLGQPPDGKPSLRRVRAGPSPVPQQSSSTLPENVRNGKIRSEYSSSEEDPRRSPDSEPIYYFESTNNRYIPAGKKSPEIQYIDLDLESDVTNASTGSSQPAGPTTTVYKTVDFLKTEAFNRTRQEVEEERNKLPAE